MHQFVINCLSYTTNNVTAFARNNAHTEITPMPVYMPMAKFRPRIRMRRQNKMGSVVRESAYYFFVAISDPDAFDRLQADHSGLHV